MNLIGWSVIGPLYNLPHGCGYFRRWRGFGYHCVRIKPRPPLLQCQKILCNETEDHVLVSTHLALSGLPSASILGTIKRMVVNYGWGFLIFDVLQDLATPSPSLAEVIVWLQWRRLALLTR